MSSVCVVIQCRLGSQRLPNKALALIGDKPMIVHVYERALAIEGKDDVLVAVPNISTRTALIGVGLPADKVVAYPHIPENDVLSRYAAVAEQFQSHDVFVRLTGDCPLLDPKIAEEVIALYREHKAGRATYGAVAGWYAWNDTLVSGFPDGEDVEVFGRGLLCSAAMAMDLHPEDMEHVTTWMRRHASVAVLGARLASKLKLSVDTEADLERVRAIYAKLKNKADYSLAATLKAAKAVGV